MMHTKLITNQALYVLYEHDIKLQLDFFDSIGDFKFEKLLSKEIVIFTL